MTSYQKLKYKLENAEDKLYKINQWCDAYPVESFPVPKKHEWEDVKLIFEMYGLAMGNFTAENFRHVLKGVKEIIEEGK